MKYFEEFNKIILTNLFKKKILNGFQFDEDTKHNSTRFRPALNIRRMKTSLEDCIEVKHKT